MDPRIFVLGVVLAVALTPVAAQDSTEPAPAAAESGSTPDSGASAADVSTREEPAASTSEPDGAQAAGTSEVLDTIPVAPAESAEEPAPQERAQNRLVEEIVVTAQKREENIQDVPISIQAFSGEGLAARGLEDTDELGQAVPSLQFTGVAGFTLIFMRGIGTDNFIPSADPSIATYLDGIYIPPGHAATTSLGNIERVEVLKGPQGTLFGRNSTGGAISIVTEEPGDEFKASVEGVVGNFNERSGKASISGPLTDWLSAGIDGLYSKADPFTTNINYEVDPDKYQAVRGKVNLHPTDNLSLSLTGLRARQSGLSTGLNQNTNPSTLGTAAGIQPEKDDFESESDFEAEQRSTQDIDYGNLTWNLPWFDLKLLGSNQYILTSFASTDFDGSPRPLAAFDAEHEYTRLKTGELQFVSNDETWGADRFKWVVGLYYLESRAGFDPAHFLVSPQAFQSLLDVSGQTFPQGIRDLVEQLPADFTPLEDGGFQVQFSGLLGTRSRSVFAQGTFSFTDWLDLTLGGRYQKEKRFLTKSETSALDPTSGAYTVPLFDFELQHATATNFSPKVVLSARPRDDAMVYASYSVGFKSGTYNVVNINAPPNYIEPEEVTTYEVGAKVDFLEGLLRLNGAVFYNTIDNLQSGFVSVLSGGAVRFQTAGKARTQGAEIDGTFLPFPNWNPGLALSGNAAYVDATYTDFRNGGGFQEGTGVFMDNQDYTGNHIVRTPKVSGGVGIVQTIQGSRGVYEIAIDEYYNSGFFYDPANNVEENRYSTLNARVGYLHEPWGLRLTLFGKNLLDERYHNQQFQTDFGILKTLAAPRQYGLRLNWEF